MWLICVTCWAEEDRSWCITVLWSPFLFRLINLLYVTFLLRLLPDSVSPMFICIHRLTHFINLPSLNQWNWSKLSGGRQLLNLWVFLNTENTKFNTDSAQHRRTLYARSAVWDGGGVLAEITSWALVAALHHSCTPALRDQHRVFFTVRRSQHTHTHTWPHWPNVYLQ